MSDFEAEVQKEMRRLMEQHPQEFAPEELNPDEFEQEVQKTMETLKREQYESQVNQAMRILAEQRKETPAQEPSYTVGERAGQLLRGVPAAYGGISDLLVSGGEALARPIKKKLHPALQRISKNEIPPLSEEMPPNLRDELPKLIDKLYGKDLSPQDKTGRFLQDIGSFFAPLPVPGAGGIAGGLAAKAVPKMLVKGLGKNLSGATGASAAINLTPRITDEGTIPGAAEDIVKGAIGARIGANPVPVVKGIGRAASSIGKTVTTNPVKTAENLAAKGMSKFMTLDEEALELSKKHDIKLPFNVGAGSDVLDSVANNYLKSVFTSKKYKQSLDKTNQSIIDSVRRAVEMEPNAQIGKLTPSAASEAFMENLHTQRKGAHKRASALYKESEKALGKKTVAPSNLSKTLNSKQFDKLVNTKFMTPKTREVVDEILKLRAEYNKTPVLETAQKSEQEIRQIIEKNYPRMNEASIKEIIERSLPEKDVSIKKTKPIIEEVPVGDLISLRQYLNDALEYNPKIYGVKNLLSRLRYSVDKDIDSVVGKKGLHMYRDANKFYRENVGERFNNFIAESIMKRKRPSEAYNLMNSVRDVRSLRQIAYKDQASRQLYDALKNAKIREILGTSIEGDLSKEGTIRTLPFSKLFQKGEKRNELLYELLGGRRYESLSELSEISGVFSKHGRNLLNTSSTAHVASDFDVTKDAFNQTLKVLGYIMNGGAGVAGGVAGYHAAGAFGAASGAALAGAFTRMAMPNIVSRLVSDEKFVSQARNYAKARITGRLGQSKKILDNQLLPIALPITVVEMGKIKEQEAEESQGEDNVELH